MEDQQNKPADEEAVKKEPAEEEAAAPAAEPAPQPEPEAKPAAEAEVPEAPKPAPEEGAHEPEDIDMQAQEAAPAPASDAKVLGIPADKFARLCYVLVLTASGFGLFANFVGLVGVYVPGGQLFAIVGLAGLALAVVGWQAFPKDFTPIDLSHFRYITILFAAFFIIGIICGTALGWFGFLGALLLFLITIAQVGLLWAGLNLWKAGKEATQDTVKAEVMAMKDMLMSKIKKADDGVE